ncbi:MAG: hypothetical protein ABSG53_31865 [Thermoguttaceae bacterium]|jgi:hypothetical protein
MKLMRIWVIGAAMLACVNLAMSQERLKRPAASKPAADVSVPGDLQHALMTISKETTYITGPLRKDGYVDYIAALNQRFREGVTPENNAAVPFLKAMWPAEIDRKYRDEYCRMLDIRPLPEKGDYFVTIEKYVAKVPNDIFTAAELHFSDPRRVDCWASPVYDRG